MADEIDGVIAVSGEDVAAAMPLTFRYTPDPDMGGLRAEDLDGRSGFLVSGALEIGAPVDIYPVTFPTRSERIRNEARARLRHKRWLRARDAAIVELRDSVGMFEGCTMLVDAMLAVLDLHAPEDKTSGYPLSGCRECRDWEGDLVEWPCATVVKVAEVLGVNLPAQ